MAAPLFSRRQARFPPELNINENVEEGRYRDEGPGAPRSPVRSRSPQRPPAATGYARVPTATGRGQPVASRPAPAASKRSTSTGTRRKSGGTRAPRLTKEERAEKYMGLPRAPGRAMRIRNRQNSASREERRDIYGNALTATNTGQGVLPRQTRNPVAAGAPRTYFPVEDRSKFTKGGKQAIANKAYEGYEDGAYRGHRAGTRYMEVTPVTAATLAVMAGDATAADIATFVNETAEWNDDELINFANLPLVKFNLSHVINRGSVRASGPGADRLGFVMGKNGKLYPTATLAIIASAGSKLPNIIDIASEINGHTLTAPEISLDDAEQLLGAIGTNLRRPGQTSTEALSEAAAYVARQCPGGNVAQTERLIRDIAAFAGTLNAAELKALIKYLGLTGVIPVADFKRARYAGGSFAPYSVGINEPIANLLRNEYAELDPAAQGNAKPSKQRNHRQLLYTLGWALVSNCNALDVILDVLAQNVGAKWDNWQAQEQQAAARAQPRIGGTSRK